MYERLAEIAAAPGDVRALVITGAGDKAFAAGTDINQFRAFSGADDAMAYEARIDRVLGRMERCPVPTIAAIAGACTGGGAAIAAACDLRIAAANARFGFPDRAHAGQLPVDVQHRPPVGAGGSCPGDRDDLHRAAVFSGGGSVRGAGDRSAA